MNILTFEFDLEEWKDYESNVLIKNMNDISNYPSPAITFKYASNNLSFNVEFHDNLHHVNSWEEFARKIRKSEQGKLSFTTSNGYVGIETDGFFITFTVSRFGSDGDASMSFKLPIEECIGCFESIPVEMNKLFAKTLNNVYE